MHQCSLLTTTQYNFENSANRCWNNYGFQETLLFLPNQVSFENISLKLDKYQRLCFACDNIHIAIHQGNWQWQIYSVMQKDTGFYFILFYFINNSFTYIYIYSQPSIKEQPLMKNIILWGWKWFIISNYIYKRTIYKGTGT